jgi:hypothetical protein
MYKLKNPYDKQTIPWHNSNNCDFESMSGHLSKNPNQKIQSNSPFYQLYYHYIDLLK